MCDLIKVRERDPVLVGFYVVLFQYTDHLDPLGIASLLCR